jgi:hypothetical protein
MPAVVEVMTRLLPRTNASVLRRNTGVANGATVLPKRTAVVPRLPRFPVSLPLVVWRSKAFLLGSHAALGQRTAVVSSTTARLSIRTAVLAYRTAFLNWMTAFLVSGTAVPPLHDRSSFFAATGSCSRDRGPLSRRFPEASVALGVKARGRGPPPAHQSQTEGMSCDMTSRPRENDDLPAAAIEDTP